MKPQQLITPKVMQKEAYQHTRVFWNSPGLTQVLSILSHTGEYLKFTEEQTGSVCLAEPGGGRESIPRPWVSQTSLDTPIRLLLFSLGPWDLQLLSGIKRILLI